MDKFVVLINKTSGTVLRLGEERVRDMVQERLGNRLVSLELIETANLKKSLQRLAKSKPEAVVIGGGDGTAVCAAEILGPARVPFAVLPLGTMNLLAQDLGSAPDFEQTILKFENLARDEIDIGMVNDRMFLCSAVIGFVPESAVVREELRDEVSLENMARFLSTLKRGLIGDDKKKLYLKSKKDDEPFAVETTSLIISNNSFVKNPKYAGDRFFRETLSDGKLAVYSAAPKDMLDGLKMALSLWQGDWQEHESIRSFETSELIVETDTGTTLVSLDGEPMEMKGPLCFSVKPKSLSVLRMELSV